MEYTGTMTGASPKYIDNRTNMAGVFELGLIVVLFLCCTNCYASGFRVPGGFSIAGLSMADTLVANPVELGALPYNPSAMSFHEEGSIGLGLIAVEPRSRVRPAGENSLIGDDADSSILVPNLYVMQSVSDDWAFGLGINSPFGLETNWKMGTFPAFTGPVAPLEPAKSRLEMVNLNPNLSYRYNNNLAVAFGVDYYKVFDATLDTQGVHISGEGEDIGWNAAFIYVVERWSIGLSYRSAVKVDIDGEFDATSVLGFKVNSQTVVEFPDILQLGIRYQINEGIAVEFDVDNTGWSTFNEVVVKSKGNVPAAGTVLATEKNSWSDTNSYHVAMNYQLLSGIQLRLGYTLNQNPQPESSFSPRYPNARRHLLSTGFKLENETWDLEAGILYGKWENRIINNNAPYTGGDANGTAAYNGKYDLDGVLIGMGANIFF